jgi:hypothetical protein
MLEVNFSVPVTTVRERGSADVEAGHKGTHRGSMQRILADLA